MGKSEMIEYATKLKLKEDLQKLASLSESQSFHFALAPNQETPVMVLDKKKAFDRQKFKTALGKKLSTDEVGGVKTDILYIGTLKKGDAGKPEFTVDETKSFGTISTSVFERTVKQFKDVPGCNALSTPITKLSSVVAREELSETRKQKLEDTVGKQKKVVNKERLSKPEKKVVKTVERSQKQYDRTEEAKLAEVQAKLVITGGSLDLPEDVTPVVKGEPGVKGHFTSNTTISENPSEDAPGNTWPAAKKGRCIVRDTDDERWFFVESYKEEDNEIKLGEKGYVRSNRVKKDQKYKPITEPLFTKKPSVDDIHQGNLGDCYFLAGLMSVVDKNPDYIQSLMKDNGDGTITVKLFDYDTESRSSTEKYYTIQKTTLVSNDGRVEHSEEVPWVEIMEKAWAALRSERKTREFAKKDSGGVTAKELSKSSYSMVGIESGGGDEPLMALTGGKTSGTKDDIVSSKKVFTKVFLDTRLPKKLGISELQATDTNKSKLIGSLKGIGLSDHGAEETFKALKAYGGFYYEGDEIKDILTEAGLLDGMKFKAGFVAEVEQVEDTEPKKKPDVWLGTTRKILLGDAKSPDYQNLRDFQEMEEVQALSKESAPRKDEVDALLNSSKVASLLGSTLQQKLKGLAAGKFPGKRMTGHYSASDLQLWDKLKELVSTDCAITVGTPKIVGSSVDGLGKSHGEKVSKGIAGGHEYSVLGLYEPREGEPFYVKPQKGGVPIKYAVLRNPWNDQDPDRENPTAGRIYVAVRNKQGRIIAYKARGNQRSEFLLALSDLTKRFDSISISQPLRAPWGNVEKGRLREGFKLLVKGVQGLDQKNKQGVTLTSALYEQAKSHARRFGVDNALDWVNDQVSKLPREEVEDTPEVEVDTSPLVSDTVNLESTEDDPPVDEVAPDATFTISDQSYSLMLSSGSTANPVLHFRPGVDGIELLVGTPSGGGWQRVEQFCSVLSGMWLKSPRPSLKFGDLNKTGQVSAVKILLKMGSDLNNIGLTNQVNWAKSFLGGAERTASQMTEQLAGYKVGALIWYGDGGHVKAATVKEKGAKLTVYDSNSGGTKDMSLDDFVGEEVTSHDAFVVAAI
jgi:hypothetical protein